MSDLCWMCGAPGRPYMKGRLCDEHARAQGIQPREKRDQMSFAGQAEAEATLTVVPDLEPEIGDTPWAATASGNYERISVTFKHGTGFDEPWVVFKGHTVNEVSELIAEFRGAGGFAAVATVASEFKGSKSVADAAVAAVQQAIPGSTVVQQPAAQPQQQAPPAQANAACDTCGAPTVYASGTSRKNGKPWAHFKCTANGDHVRWIR